MATLIVYPKNKEQRTALKTFLKAMNIPFERRNDIYPSRVVQGVKTALKQAEVGQLIPYNGVENLLKDTGI